MTCLHDSRAVCWLCSDAVSWWAEARERAGVPHPRVTPAVVAEPGPVAPLPVEDGPLWAELTDKQRRMMALLDARDDDGIDLVAFKSDVLPELYDLRLRGIAGVDVTTKRWHLGIKGRAVLADYRAWHEALGARRASA